MMKEITEYIENLPPSEKQICFNLLNTIENQLDQAESKIWHSHPVWFINQNPIVGFSKQKAGIRLMFWSGADFEEDALNVRGQKFKDASIFYTEEAEINITDLSRWIQKAIEIQWDYKNIVKRKGKLERIV